MLIVLLTLAVVSLNTLTFKIMDYLQDRRRREALKARVYAMFL